MNTNPLFNLSYGLFVLTAKEGDRDNGCIINTVMQITDNPKRIVIGVNKANYTNGMIRRTGKFNVSILTEKAKFDTFKRFGFQSGADTDKFEGFNGIKRSKNGLIYINEQVNSYIACTVEAAYDMGSHTMFIGAIDDMEVLNDDPSVTYAYYHKNIKPQPPKPQKKKWVCQMCGYVHEGDELPEDFTCPMCCVDASLFKAQEPAPASDKKKWVCNICGYTYEGDELPDDFVCPLCKHGADDFSPVN